MILLDFGQMIQADQAALQSRQIDQNNQIRQAQMDYVLPYQLSAQAAEYNNQALLAPGALQVGLGQQQVNLGQQGQQLWQQGQDVNARPAQEATNAYNNALSLGRANLNQSNLGTQLAQESDQARINQIGTANQNRLNLGLALGTAEQVPGMIQSGLTGQMAQTGNAQRQGQLNLELLAGRQRSDQLSNLSSILAPTSGATPEQKAQAVQSMYPGAVPQIDPATGAVSVQAPGGQILPIDQVIRADLGNIGIRNNQIISELSPPSDTVRAAQIRADGYVRSRGQTGNNILGQLLGDTTDLTSTIPGSANYNPNASTSTTTLPAQSAGQATPAPSTESMAPAISPAAAQVINNPTQAAATPEAVTSIQNDIKSLQPTLTQQDNEVKRLDKEFQAAEAALSRLRGSTEGNAQARSLARNQAQEKRLEARNQLAAARAQYQATLYRMQQLQVALTNSQQAIGILGGAR